MRELILSPLYGMILGDDRVTSSSYLPCGPLWFLVALFVIKNCFYFLSRFACLLKIKLFEVLYWVSLILFFVALYLLLGNRFPYYSLDSAFLSIPFYIMGFLMKKVSIPISFEKKSISYVMGIFILVYLLLVGLTNGRVDIDAGVYGHNLVLFYLNGLLGSFLVLLLCGLFTKPMKFVQYIGANTMIVLGMHLITLRFLKFFMLYVLGISISSNTIFKSIIISIASFILCYPFIVLINRFTPWMIGKTCNKKMSMS